METPKVTIDIKDNVEIKDSILIMGFPGPGLSSAIAVNYIIEQLDMPKIGTLSSEVFPALAVIRDYMPGHPIRLHGNNGFMVLASEMAPMDALARLISDSLISFTREKGIPRVICLEAVVNQHAVQGENLQQMIESADTARPEPEVFVVGSTPEIKRDLQEKKLNLFREGMITGVSGLLLSEGERLGLDVICILTEANPMFPDARAAARLIEVLKKLEPVQIDMGKLTQQADEIEDKVKDSMQQAQQYLDAQQKQQAPEQRVVPTHMYG